jgi:hypothetical protein
MKKVFTLGLLLTCSILSFGQRYVDIALTMSSPDSGMVIDGTQPFTFTATIKNNGPDTLKTTDTLVLGFDLDGASTLESMTVQGQTTTEIAFTLSAAMPSGASAQINQQFAFANSPSDGQHELCALIVPLNRSADSVKDTVTANDKSCTTIIVSTTAVPNVAANKMSASVFPNPMYKSATIDLDLPVNGNVRVTVSDLFGRTVYEKSYENLSIGKNKVALDVSNIPSGNYILNVGTSYGSSHEKIIIQQ